MTEGRTVRLVISLIGGALAVTVVSIAVLAYMGRTVPEALSSIGSTALGALGAMLASTRTTAAPPPTDPQGGHDVA
jgi:hypothetical protein